MVSLQQLLVGHEKICVVGLGYVGLPLAVLLGQKFNVIGFDINKKRVLELKEGDDSTNEVDRERLLASPVQFTSNAEVIKEAKVIIVTVPTPIDEHKRPDLTPVKLSTKTVGQYLQKGSIVVYESTVYPGVTEDICVPILESESGLSWKKDFNVGYSPERINPGDKEHTVEKILKIVSGDNNETLELLADIYGSVIIAGIHKTKEIKTAEAAKVIENIQRDLNIALINELAIIFHKMEIDTLSVLEAAGTKWNFIPFRPGLVGGHCIGVDPYYLTFKAESLGYDPQVILAGRQINNSMGKYIAENSVKQLIKAGRVVKGSKVLILGLTFKENTPDVRNTRVIDIDKELREYEVETFIYEPSIAKEMAKEEYDIDLIDSPEEAAPFDAVVIAVKHDYFIENYNLDIYKKMSRNNELILIDVKGLYKREEAEHECFAYWRL